MVYRTITRNSKIFVARKEGDKMQKKVSVKPKGFASKVKRLTKEKGLRYVLHAAILKIKQKLRIPFWYNYYRFFKSWRKFTFQKNSYRYFYNIANTTWRNERTVEIPIVWSIVQSSKGNILEVGNVLSHYFDFEHEIVDKYEKGVGVINEDIIAFRPAKKYDLIISISTLEHVGWDENPIDRKILGESEKVLSAINKLKELLAPNGKIIVTVPLGYNLHLDNLIKTGKLKFDKQFYLKRASRDTWIETDWKGVIDAKFNFNIPSANAILIGVFERAPI